MCKETGEVWALKLIQNSVFQVHLQFLSNCLLNSSSRDFFLSIQKNRERTEEEVKVLASLDHPGCVKLREGTSNLPFDFSTLPCVQISLVA
jgi:serine/threonine protein kinase